MAATGSSVDASTVWVAPNCLASSSFRASRSTAMIVRGAGQAGAGDGGVAHAAAAEHGDAVARPDLAGVHGRAEPGHHAAPEQPGDLRLHLGRHLGALAGGDERLLGEGADAERRRQRHAVERHLLRGVVGAEAVPGPAPAARPALAAHRPPVQDHEVAGRHVGDVGADRLDDARRLVAEQERELVVDPALPVVEVGVAHAARLHLHERLARARVGHLDHLDRDRLLHRLGHHRPNLLRHSRTP